MDTSIIKWLESWYLSNCNGDWEHSYGITIETTDNPGWRIKIDLNSTSLQNEKIEYTLNEKDENDWYGVKVENAEFVAGGDPNKLLFLIELFKQFVEKGSKK